MDSIHIDTGEKRIAVNGDPERVIVFNPTDVIFAERFYALIGEFESKLTEYQDRSKSLDVEDVKDKNGIPLNSDERLALLHEVCEYIRERIDYLFGKGTSQKAFGDALALDMFTQFFKGITPFIQNSRTSKVEKYVNPVAERRTKRKSK